jgi:hypothetical protein
MMFGSTLLGHFPHHPEVKGSIPATADTGKEHMIKKKVQPLLLFLAAVLNTMALQ